MYAGVSQIVWFVMAHSGRFNITLTKTMNAKSAKKKSNTFHKMEDNV